MQKVLRFLEANVEWIALAIAILFLGWASWTYLINDPVSRKLDGEEVGPGTVDQHIASHALERLAEKMDPNATPPEMVVPPFIDTVKAKIGLDGLQPPELATADFDYAPFDMSVLGGPNPQKIGPPVTELPTVPVAQPLLIAAGLNTIAPATTPPAAAGGAAPATDANSATAGKDVRMVVAAYTIPWSEIYKQWNNSFGPAKPGQPFRLNPAGFEILSVTAYRSEKINDTWSKDEPIEILNGADLPPYPAPGNKAAALSYQQALAKSPKTVASPDFPTVTAGVAWKDPLELLAAATTPNPANGTPPDQNNNGAMNVNPSRLPTANVADPLNGTLLAQYRGGAPGGGYGGFGGRPPIAPPAYAPPAAATPAQAAPPPPIAPAEGTVSPIVKLMKTGEAPNPMPVEPTVSSLSNVIALPVKSPDLCVYIIDTSAEAGKTYRYRISYKVYNPLYNKPPEQVAKTHENWVNQFDIASELSDYSPEIEVPKQTYFFCGKSVGGKNTFPFEVFTWTHGKWLKDIFNASVGDPIGGMDGGIDYSTGWTYAADIRSTAKNKYMVTLVDNEGNVDTRDATQDPNSPDYKKAAQWVEQTKNGAPQPGAAPMPSAGNPYGGGPQYGGVPGYGPGPMPGQPPGAP